jgi:DNA-binding NarL/FixJ family response regulator
MRALGLPVPRGPRLSTRANPALLTARELEVLKKIAVHESNAEIAQHLYLSPKTVEHHISAILSKLQVSTRGQALVEAERRNLISQNGDHRSLI